MREPSADSVVAQGSSFWILFLGTKSRLCAGPRYVPLSQESVIVAGGRTFSGTHNDHSELSHFINSSSFCHPVVGRGVSERPMGGKQTATAASFVRKVISA